MLPRKLAVAAIGLSLFGLGPAATLVGAEPARADPPSPCQATCINNRVADRNRCAARVPPLPSQDDMIEYGWCMVAADVASDDCNLACN